MVEQLRNPPKGTIDLSHGNMINFVHETYCHCIILSLGFEDVIQVHFAIQREAIMKQLSQWVKEVISPEHERKLRRAIDDFIAEMDKL